MVYLDCGCLISEKRGDAIAQDTVIPQQLAGSLQFTDTEQTVLEQRVLMLSSLLLKLAQENESRLPRL